MPETQIPFALSPLGFDETLARLRAAILAEELWILHEIDPQMLLAREGHRIGAARQLLFFHPRYMVRLLAANPFAVIEAPLKIAVLELPDGRVLLRHPDSAAALAAYPGLEELAREIREIYPRILAAVTA